MSVVQSKTHTPIVSELNGATLNALADYILDWRPKCDITEVFVTVKAPYRRLSKGFGSMIDKYCEKAGVSKIAFRGFHSLRRSFETVMVSRGVPIETVSQMMGHKSIIEDKPYITHDTHQISFEFGKSKDIIKYICLSFVSFLPLFYFSCIYYFGSLIFCCQFVAILL